MLLALTLGLLTACPDRSAIESRLDAPRSGEQRQFTVREFDHDHFEITVTVSAAGGERKFKRVLPKVASCEARAQVAAAVVAAWEISAPDLPRLTWPNRYSTEVELGAAFVGSVTGGSFAPGGELSLRLEPRPGLGINLGAVGHPAHAVALGSGTADWTRFTLETGLDYRFAMRRITLDLEGGLLTGFLFFRGRDFDVSHRAFDVDVGLSAGLRGAIDSRTLRGFKPFLRFCANGWLRGEKISALDPATNSVALPRFELWLAAGVAWDPKYSRRGRSR